MVAIEERELGGSIAEAAIAIPLVIVLFGGALQLGLQLFSISSLQAQIQDAAAASDLSQIPVSANQAALDAAVRAELAEHAIGIDVDKMEVSSSRLELSDRIETAQVDPKETSVDTISSKTTVARLTARVEYPAPRIVGIGSEKILAQDIDISQTISNRTEVGGDGV